MLDLGYTGGSPLTATQPICSGPMLLCQTMPDLTEMLLTDEGYKICPGLCTSVKFVTAASS